MIETLKHLFKGCDYQAVARTGHTLIACTFCGEQYKPKHPYWNS